MLFMSITQKEKPITDPTFNGKDYEWSGVKFMMMGKDIDLIPVKFHSSVKPWMLHANVDQLKKAVGNMYGRKGKRPKCTKLRKRK